MYIKRVSFAPCKVPYWEGNLGNLREAICSVRLTAKAVGRFHSVPKGLGKILPTVFYVWKG
jgi:hypothetical protein